MRGSFFRCCTVAALLALLGASFVPSAKAQNPPHNYRYRAPYYRPCPPCYESPAAPTTTAPQVDANGNPIEPRATNEPDLTTEPSTAPASPAPSTLASSAGSAAPAMIGDHFGNGYSFANGGDLPTAGGLRRVKIAENVSPMPQDRVFVNFNHFNNSVTRSDNTNHLIDLQRYTVGLEKTFFSGMASVEVRAPMTDGLNSTQNTLSGFDNEGFEFGNMVVTTKALVAANSCTRLAAGMGVQLPTADEANLYTGDTLITHVDNHSVHLQPFIGWMSTPNSRAFVIAYAQLDIDLSGYDAQNTLAAPIGPGASGHFNDPVFLYLDAQYGYWVYQNCCCNSWLTGIAPVVEIHYATNLDSFDVVPGVIDADRSHVDIVNLTGGLKFQIGRLSTLTLSGVAPLSGQNNRQFDAEGIAQFTRRF